MVVDIDLFLFIFYVLGCLEYIRKCMYLCMMYYVDLNIRCSIEGIVSLVCLIELCYLFVLD